MTDDDPEHVKEELTNHWDWDYMTDEQRAKALKDGKRPKPGSAHAKPGTREQRDASHAFAEAPEAESVPDWRYTGIAAVVVAAATLIAWLVWQFA